MSGNLLKKIVSHYLLSLQKPVLQSWFFCLLIGECEVNSKGNNSCINLIFIPFHSKFIWGCDPLMERAYFSIKFKNDIESLNKVLSVILKIKRENAINHNFKLKFNVLSNTYYLWIGILKTCNVFLIRRWHFSCAN